MSSLHSAEETQLNDSFESLIQNVVPGFKVLDETLVPEGLNPHTRSICWLAEQVLLQNLRANKDNLAIAHVISPDSDISTWDANIKFKGASDDFFVNIKVSDIAKPRRRNDIASIKSLLRFYRENPSANLFFVVVKLGFENCFVRFHEGVISRGYPGIAEYVLNKRNGHLQSYYDCPRRDATNIDMCREIAEKSLQIGYKLEKDLTEWLHC